MGFNKAQIRPKEGLQKETWYPTPCPLYTPKGYVHMHIYIYIYMNIYTYIYIYVYMLPPPFDPWIFGC